MYTFSMSFGSFIRAQISNRLGASYIHIILGLFTLTSMAFLGIKMQEDEKTIARDIYYNYLLDYLHQEITFFLEEDKNCQTSLKGTSFGLLEIKSLRSLKSKREFFSIYNLRAKSKGNTHYYSAPIEVKSYALLAWEDPKVAFLEVSYGWEDQRISKKIPLAIELDENQKIKTCTVLGDRNKYREQDGWIKDGLSIKTQYQNIKLGSADLEGEGIILEEGIFFVPESDLLHCEESSFGVIRNIKGKGLRFCKQGAWFPLGNQPLKTNSFETYKVAINKVGSQVTNTSLHRHCFISKIKKDTPSDGCQLRRNTKDTMSSFEITAFTSSAATFMDCEVSCVD